MLGVPAEEQPRPGKRRKTLGDSPSSSYHTQTLTQMLSEKGTMTKMTRARCWKFWTQKRTMSV